MLLIFHVSRNISNILKLYFSDFCGFLPIKLCFFVQGFTHYHYRKRLEKHALKGHTHIKLQDKKTSLFIKIKIIILNNFSCFIVHIWSG